MAIVNLFEDASRKTPRRRASDAAYLSHGANLLERDAPLAQLYRAAEAAAEGHGSLVAVAGEAGLGKTSLLEAFAKGIAATHAVHWGSCESLITPRPLGALQDISRELSDGLLDQIEQAEARSVIFATLQDCLRLAAKPTVLIFEDVHWADDGTLDLIKFLGRRLKRLSALLVVSFRDDEVDREHPLTRVLGDIPAADQSRVSLQPLSESAIEKLIANSGYTAAELHNISAGNPFFVTELIAVSKHAETDKRLNTEIPRTVSDAVLARASRLNAPAREVLEVVSLAPGKMPLPLVQSILQGDAVAGIDQCLERGVLRAVDGGQNVMFRHELARLAIEKSLPLLRRQDTHRAILRAMDEQQAKGAPGAAYDLARRVHHAAGCADSNLVLSLAPSAAKEAAALGAHREAAAHYQSALQFVAQAPLELQAELWESWSYEQSIALQIDEPVIAARHKAIALWEKLNRKDKVGLNLRWLSRLHWYRSERELAERYANEAIAVLESIPPCAELAMAYSLRSQLYMLVDDFDWAIEWGERALGAAQPENAVEVRVHAMTNIGTALLLSQRPGGVDMLMQCLALAQQHGMHEHAARVYTNYSTSLLTDKQYSRAEQFLEEGIAFDRAHDLDSWLHYLVGMYAHLKFDLGDYAECERQAQSALAVPRQTSVMRLPALSILARLKVRRGDADAAQTLSDALALALPTKEPHRIVALYLAQAELAWVESDDAACKAAVQSAIAHSAEHEENIWPLTLLQLWRARSGLPLLELDMSPAYEKSPYWLEAQGLYEEAARAWKVIGAPFEEGMAAFACGDEAGIARAIEIFTRLGAKPALEKARAAARKLGVRGIPRGPYAVAREHPLGLTQREVEVLQLLAIGASNAVIAQKLSRSERTVEHHVSALLAKLGAKNRAEAIALAHQHHVI
jgi:DNA-binding CsgD family transcriptional regulator/tetratricopeptide (TPR) repeat protein